MFEVRETDEFKAFMAGLKDLTGKARIAARIRMLAFGQWGDCEPVGKGVTELRIHVGPGYRVYVVRDGDALVIVMRAGTKSTQKRDIKRVLGEIS